MSEPRHDGPDGFADLLRQWMHDDAPIRAPDDILKDLQRSVMATAQQSRRPGWSPFVAVAAAAVAIAAVVVSVQLATEIGRQEPSDAPRPTAHPTASDVAATTSPRPSATQPPIPSSEPWTRAEVELPAVNSSRILAAAGADGGYVAVGGGGSVEGFGGVLAWHSTDGQSWSLTLDEHARQDGSQMLDVGAIASGANGYVGVGYNVQATPIWISADGLSWRELDDPSAPAGSSHSLNALAVGDDGLIAIGFTTEGDAQIATAWSSSDGEAWTRSRVPDAYARAWPVDVAVANDGSAVIVGMTEPGGGDPVAWVMTDGVIAGPITLPSEDPAASVTAVVDTGAGFTAVGHGWDPVESAYRLLAWRSADGRGWEPVEGEGVGLPLGVADIDGRGVIAVGATTGIEESEVTAWELSDDGEWQTFTVEPSNGAGEGVLERPDGRLMVVGASDPDGEARVWIAP
jgi:hypothetical protein